MRQFEVRALYKLIFILIAVLKEYFYSTAIGLSSPLPTLGQKQT